MSHAFRDDDPNPAQRFAGIPPILRKKLLMEGRESEKLGFPRLVKIWIEDQLGPLTCLTKGIRDVVSSKARVVSELPSLRFQETQRTQKLWPYRLLAEQEISDR